METLIQQAQNIEHRLELDTQEMAGSRQAGASTGKPRQKAGKWSRGMKTKEKKVKSKDCQRRRGTRARFWNCGFMWPGRLPNRWRPWPT